MATYGNDLRLKEINTGDEAGTWGTSTNTNLELISEALSYGTQNCFSSDASATTTVADGASDPARSIYFKVTSSATLTATRTLTIAPNTISRLMFIENATTGGQSIAISQGSGANVTISNGAVKAIYLDGAGSGAAVVDAFSDLSLPTVTVSDLTATTTSFGTLAVTGNSTLDGTAVVKEGLPIIDEAGTSKTLALTDNGGYIVTSSGSAVTITVPPNSSVAFPVGAEIVVFQSGSGQVTFVAGSGVTIRSKDSNLKITAQYAAATLKKVATDEWHLLGDLGA